MFLLQHSVSFTRLMLIGGLVLVSLTASAQNQKKDLFITVWNADKAGEQFTMPINSKFFPYLVDIGNDGTFEKKEFTLPAKLIFPKKGKNIVAVKWKVKDGSSEWFMQLDSRLLSIEQWGTRRWSRLSFQYITTKLKFNDPLSPIFAKRASLAEAFKGSPEFNENINHWDVSNVINMAEMFQNSRAFNQPLDKWTVSNVTNMQGMFQQAISFNQPLNSWNVASVINMSFMFLDAKEFNQPLSAWDVSRVENMKKIFEGASKFDQDISDWDIKSVKNF